MTDCKNAREPEHSTITFCLGGTMDDESAAAALRRLGAGVAPPAATEPSGKPGRWLACGLRSDGVIELWPAADSGGAPGGGAPGGEAPPGGRLEDLLASAGLPYELPGRVLPG